MYEHTYCMQPSAILLDNFLFLRKKQVHVLVLMEIIKKKLKNVYIDFFLNRDFVRKFTMLSNVFFFPTNAFQTFYIYGYTR